MVLALIACNEHQPTLVKRVLVHSYASDDQIHTSDRIYLTKLISADTTHFIYSDTIFTKELYQKGRMRYGHPFMKLTQNDSSLYFDVNAPLTAQKNFEVNGQTFKISRYSYNLENSAGEETNYFYHPHYGLLVVYNEGCFPSLAYTMELDQTSKSLVDRILQDRTGFYIEPDMSIQDSWIDADTEALLDSAIKK